MVYNLHRRCQDLRRRLQASSAASVGVGESQPQRALLDEGTVHRLCIIVIFRFPGHPLRWSSVHVLSHCTCVYCVSFFLFPYARTKMIQRRFRGTEVVPTRLLGIPSQVPKCIVHRNRKYPGQHADLTPPGQGISRPQTFLFQLTALVVTLLLYCLSLNCVGIPKIEGF